ncbi:class I SAM-dependent methyltransferase [Paenibacillus wulumuqiensis]|uniref:class I SAM-dependent methyltransferase n=1 Tax=Paenibacillus wulumuqiensis TaxID=1567107 RepID=UPI000619A6A1|nr:class I SAM-dependent methyltransferase [Paenibacillus wulumuqiensis]
MRESQYKAFYDRVGLDNGWDFSRMKCETEGAAWDFYGEISRRCRPDDLLLDIGTGGGEALLELADAARLLVGVEQSTGMMQTAAANLAASGKHNVRILQMDARELQFPDGFFNIVSCRHAPFDEYETFRVLADGGVFLTQQVSEGDKRNLVQAFGREQERQPDGTLMNRYLDGLEQAGFRNVRCEQYDADEYYATAEDLVFLLKHAPIIPDFGRDAEDFVILDRFVQEYRTDRGIVTNSKRFMIMADK